MTQSANPFEAPRAREGSGPRPGYDLPSREYGLGDVLGVATDVVRTHWALVVGLTLVVYLPINAATELLYGDAEELTDIAQSFRFMRSMETLFGILVGLGAAIITDAAVRGETLSAGELARRITSRWWKGILATILAGLVMVGLLLALVVPGIMAMVHLVFVTPVVALRDTTVSDALRYSRDLVRGRAWRIFGYGIIAVTAVSAIYLGPAFAVEAAELGDTAAFVVQLAGDLASTYVAIATTVLFLNLDRLLRGDGASEGISTGTGGVG
ncbi:hypothetical protein L6R52_40500 [Myxococcota bacterium]|nr:hypothetical protein [Myxococcota bacterium]